MRRRCRTTKAAAEAARRAAAPTNLPKKSAGRSQQSTRHDESERLEHVGKVVLSATRARPEQRKFDLWRLYGAQARSSRQILCC